MNNGKRSEETKKKVNEIENTPYGQNNVSCEPSHKEIEEAVNNDDFELRPFQNDQLERELWQEAGYDPKEFYRIVKKYHTRRIAYFVVCGWNDPIVLKSDGHTIKDGLHRLKAAIYKKMKDVTIEIESSTKKP